jgi:hypothetical protein
MEELSREKVRPLLSALRDPSPAVRLAVLRALVRLRLDPRVWLEISDGMLRLLRVRPEGESFSRQTIEGLPFGEVIEAAVFVPTDAVRDRLHGLLLAADPDLRKAVLTALARARDPVVVQDLLGELGNPNDYWRSEIAEYLSLLEVPRPYVNDLRKAYRMETDGDVRFWLALTLARAEGIEEIEQVLEEINQGKTELKASWGDPAVLRGKLARIGPFPQNAGRRFRELARDENVSPLVGLICNALQPPDQEPAAPGPPPMPPADPERKAEALDFTRRLDRGEEFKGEFLRESLTSDLLLYLLPEMASRAVSAMFQRSVQALQKKAENEKFFLDHFIDGNTIVDAVQVLTRAKAYIPDLQGLWKCDCQIWAVEGEESYRLKSYPFHQQIAWAASRAGLEAILDQLGPRLGSGSVREKVAAAELIAAAARHASSDYPPIYGGASEPPDISPPATASIKHEKPHEGMVPEEKKAWRGAKKEPPASPAEPQKSPPSAKAGEEPRGPVRPKSRTLRRVVNTGFAPQTDPDSLIAPTMPLQTGEVYFFWLDIGRPEAKSMEVTPVDIPAVSAKTRLTVALFGFADGLEITPGADIGELEVQENGQVRVVRQPLESSPPGSRYLKRRLFFPVRTPRRSGTYRMRCNIYRGQILLQSRLISAQTADHPQALTRGEKPLRSFLDDYSLVRTINPVHLNQMAEHRLSILLNQNGDGTHSFHLFGFDGREKFKQDDIRFKEGELQGMIDQARGTLRIASWGKAEEWKEGLPYRYQDRKPDVPRLKNDLSNLARWGYEFYTEIQARMAGGEKAVAAFEGMLAEPGYLQIAMKESPRYLLPSAMIYDYPLDTGLDHYELCPGFEEAFRQGRALEGEACFRGRCPSRNELTVVCPSGFWGFRHFLGMPLSVEKGADAPGMIPFQIPLRVAMGVATDLELLEAHKRNLEQLRPGSVWEYAATRDEVFKSLKGSPHVVYFYCHGGLQRDAPYLQVGSPQDPGRILPSNLTAYKIAWENPRPLVFLNGCHTTAVQPLQALDFVSRFVAKCNCAGVIGTEITIFEQLATVFAQECLRRFFAGQSIGEAVRGARLKLLSEGNPLGLVYIPFVLGGLKLVSQPGG